LGTDREPRVDHSSLEDDGAQKKNDKEVVPGEQSSEMGDELDKEFHEHS